MPLIVRYVQQQGLQNDKKKTVVSPVPMLSIVKPVAAHADTDDTVSPALSLADLPSDLVARCLAFVGVDDRLRAAGVSREWLLLARSPAAWSRIDMVSWGLAADRGPRGELRGSTVGCLLAMSRYPGSTTSSLQALDLSPYLSSVWQHAGGWAAEAVGAIAAGAAAAHTSARRSQASSPVAPRPSPIPETASPVSLVALSSCASLEDLNLGSQRVATVAAALAALPRVQCLRCGLVVSPGSDDDIDDDGGDAVGDEYWARRLTEIMALASSPRVVITSLHLDAGGDAAHAVPRLGLATRVLSGWPTDHRPPPPTVAVHGLFMPGPRSAPAVAAAWADSARDVLDAIAGQAATLRCLTLGSPPAFGGGDHRGASDGHGLGDAQLMHLVASPLFTPAPAISALRVIVIRGAHAGPAALTALFVALTRRGPSSLEALDIGDHMAAVTNDGRCLEFLADLMDAAPGMRRLALATHPTAASLVLKPRAAARLAAALERHPRLVSFRLTSAAVTKTGGVQLHSREENKAIETFADALRRTRTLKEFELRASNLHLCYAPLTREGFLATFAHVTSWQKSSRLVA